MAPQATIVAVSREQPEPGAVSTKVRKVLALIDDAETRRAVVEKLTEISKGCGPLNVILLNAQPKPNGMQTRGLFKEAILNRLREVGLQQLAQVARELDKAGVHFTCRVEFGDDTHAALRCAQEEGCDLIVIGSRPRGKARWRWLELAGMVGRSTASQLAELADAPVLVVKPRAV